MLVCYDEMGFESSFGSLQLKSLAWNNKRPFCLHVTYVSYFVHKMFVNNFILYCKRWDVFIDVIGLIQFALK